MNSPFFLNECHILYINLDHRKDRREHIESQLQKMNLMNRKNGKQTIHISGVNGQDLYKDYKKFAKEFNCKPEQMKPEYWFSRKNFRTMTMDHKKILGKVGCYLAHLRAIQYAIKHKLYPVLFIEDDCVFISNLANVPKPPKDCDMFYLGGLFWKTTKENLPKVSNKEHWMTINPKHFKIACTFSYGLMNLQSLQNNHNLLTSVWLPGKSYNKPDDWKSKTQRIRATAVDLSYINFIQSSNNSVVLIPPITIQSDSFTSDVTDIDKITPNKPFGHLYFYDKQQEEYMMKRFKKTIQLQDGGFYKTIQHPVSKEYFILGSKNSKHLIKLYIKRFYKKI